MNFVCSTPVTVVIVNYNSGSLLVNCVHAVLHQVQQIVVVDNASSDMSLIELENKLPSKKLHIVRLHNNVGFAAGCNVGFDLSTEPLILFLNPDCVLQENSLQRMVEIVESDTHIGMAGGFLVNPDGSEQGGGRRAIPTPWRAFVRAFGLYRLEKLWPRLFFDFHLNNKPLPHLPIEVEAISGALMLVKREAINEVGLWDENYFLHCEDLDLCVRFRQKKWKIIFIPDAPVVHFQGTCSRSRPFFVSWHKHKGMLRFYQKFFQRQYPKALMGLVSLAVWSRFGIAVIFLSAQYCCKLLKIRI
ncbi:glycosyltransferase family 2 protein [uncultured Nitrosomonas sp.]|uniref:glycosyltransferase family 2 protein n=1 Tax=uncultured Nitrosomonas sp. TaxID=156424 RepID=UPI0025EB8368|nr:glycosyltransferase family 2 protein [uncultured Nitrosomonas sp.]